MQPPMPQPPPAKPKYRYVGCTMMLIFAGVSLAFGASEVQLARANPEPVVLTCDQAIQEAGTRRWVRVPDCLVDFENAVEITRDDSVEQIWLPLLPVEPMPKKAPASFLVSKKKEVIQAFADLRLADAEGDDARTGEIVETLVASVTGGALGGVTETLDSRVAHFFPTAPDDQIVIAHGEEPDMKRALGVLAAGAVLSVLGVVFLLRARKLTRADQAAVAEYYAKQQAYHERMRRGPLG